MMIVSFHGPWLPGIIAILVTTVAPVCIVSLSLDNPSGRTMSIVSRLSSSSLSSPQSVLSAKGSLDDYDFEHGRHPPQKSQTRRQFFDQTLFATTTTMTTAMAFAAGFADPAPASAAAAAPPPPYRDVDVGGGFDLMNPRRPLRFDDVYYPPSMEGRWTCRRRIIKVDGDNFQASEAFRCLSGGSRSGGKLATEMTETFDAMFIKPPTSVKKEFEQYVVSDRGFDMTSRSRKNEKDDNVPVEWSVDDPNILKVGSGGGGGKSIIRIEVVDRSVEIPNDQGFGYDELLRIDDGTTLNIIRAVQIKRRFRRAYDGDGNRVVEGLELVKTFRVLDGIAGTEFPTSTVKSQLTLTRPPR
mmetsp:Transcript_56482/g.137091  ORF Transcript_56482/g.137091 Transcript_56482/m.137091 type:complete len:355 (-) Transcript_56482:860-1924(-)